jgi:hypothetical protein
MVIGERKAQIKRCYLSHLEAGQAVVPS